MPNGKDNPTNDRQDGDAEKAKNISRRSWLAMAGGTLVGATYGIGSTIGATSDHPNTIVFDGTVTTGKSTYEFEVSGSVVAADDIGSTEVKDTINGTRVTGAVHRDKDAYYFSGNLTFLDVKGNAAVSMDYGDESGIAADRLQIVASAGSSVDYTFTTTDKIVKVTDGTHAADADDTVTENEDGTYTVSGSTADEGGDTFDFWGDVTDFDPMGGEFTLFLNGEEVTAYDLTGEDPPQDDKKHSYSFVGTGEQWADYYLEVEDGGDIIASTKDGAVIEQDFHWISEDGTKAAGRVDPNERHAYEFDTLVLDVTIEGQADAYVNGSQSNLDLYPQEGATGDGWKGGFPWQENREHSYSFVGTGEQWADYYLEVEDGGDIIASTKDGAVIEEDFHWVSPDGTKAAGRVDPNERHAYEFDTLVLDVTIEGQADAYVNGSQSNLDLYPQEGATGDEWKGGFPWQEEDTTTQTGEGTVGGGSGYAETVSQDQADYVVRTSGELADALSAASSGDVVYVPGGETIDLGSSRLDVPSGVTLASDRGIDGATGGLLYTDTEVKGSLHMYGDSRLTGIRFRGPHPGDDTSGTWYGQGVKTYGPAEVDNCEMSGVGVAAIECVDSSGGDAHVHHNHLHHNNQDGRGYGVSVIRSAGQPVIEYNYFYYNRHSVASDGEADGYVVRYNHFGPVESMWPIDTHSPAGVSYEVHNNVVEVWEDRAYDGYDTCAIAIRDVPDDVFEIHDNWFWNPREPDPAGPSQTSPDQAIHQSFNQPHEFVDVEFYDNWYGESASVTYSDVIPGYDGWRSP